jgi:hypothetical protein
VRPGRSKVRAISSNKERGKVLRIWRLLGITFSGYIHYYANVFELAYLRCSMSFLLLWSNLKFVKRTLLFNRFIFGQHITKDKRHIMR